MHPVLTGAIAKLAALADEDGAARAVDSFSVIQSMLLAPTQLWIQQEFENKDSLLEVADLVQCASGLILSG